MATLSCPYCPIPKNFTPSDVNYILCKFHLHHTDKEVGCGCKYCISKKLVDNEEIPPCRRLNMLKLEQLQNQLYKKEDIEIREEIESLSSGLEIIDISQSDEHSDCQSSNKSNNETSNISSNKTSNQSGIQSDISVNNDNTDNEIVFVQSPMESFIKLNYLDD